MLEVIEEAGRICYLSEPKGDPEGFIRRLIKSKHESVLEHASLTVDIVTDRAIANELVRHRLNSFSQESTRYVCYAQAKFDGISVVMPTFRNITPEILTTWRKAVEAAEEAYIALVGAGATAQEARSVLPLCTKTVLRMSGNIRHWRTVLLQRTAKAAHPDLRDLMLCLLEDLQLSDYGCLFDDIEVDWS
jgi:thymidylate synthase (FAD)